MMRVIAGFRGGVLMAVAFGVPRLLAQTDYYNLESTRPNRIEDATATERFALAFEMPGLRVERIGGGTYRYRTDPTISYGILPFTDIGIRVPIVSVEPPPASGASGVTGVASVGLDALHAFNLETSSVPAVAVAGEWLLPYGSLSPPQSSYIMKLMATKTLSLARFHVNVGGGTWSIQSVASDTNCTRIITGPLPAGGSACGGTPIIVDSPCDVDPPPEESPGPARDVERPNRAESPSAIVPETHGRRWFAGIGADHAFALQSTLLSVDVVAEHFVGLYVPVDWTAEIGLRRQVTPKLTLDIGAARHFAGVLQSTSVTGGATYEIATPAFGQHHPGGQF